MEALPRIRVGGCGFPARRPEHVLFNNLFKGEDALRFLPRIEQMIPEATRQ